jgi:uncharacterized membrane protein YdjX (TVP38/TMEM64 family)
MTFMVPPTNITHESRYWMRMVAFGLLLLLCVLVPFVFLGGVLDKSAPTWMQAQTDKFWLALVGIALLIADVILPIPSSIVAMALCWGLGPVWGGISVAIGSMLAFTTGYGIGRLVPEPRLRRWIGPELWDKTRLRARQHALWWIVATRPLPLLAEVSALLAGVWRVPLLPALFYTAPASCVVGTLYGASAWLGLGEPGMLVTLLAILAVPSLTWTIHRAVLHRILSTRIPAQSTLLQKETL